MTITVDGSTELKTTPNKEYTFGAQGTFGGGTIYLEWSADGTVWSPISDSNGAIAFTAEGGTIFKSPARTRVRLAGASGANILATLGE